MKYTLLFSNKRFVAGFCLVAIAIILALAFLPKAKEKTVIALPQITLGKVERKSLPLEVRLPGTTQSQETILIRSQTDNTIKELHFQEGQIVQKGDLLFSVNDSALQAQLHQAEATLAKNMALLEDARLETKRNHPLVKKGFTTQSSFDKIQANEKSLDGETKANQAAIELIKVQLEYTKIKSPITGLIGLHKIEAGNFVRAAENTPLVSIVKIDPLEAIFNLPERYLKYLEVQDLSTIKIQLFDLNGDPLLQKAILFARDNAVDPNSGIIPIKIRIENPLNNGKPSILPGQYVITIIQLGKEENSLVIPLSAVQNGQNGSNVFIYDQETQSVYFRPVKLGLVAENEAVIQEGIKEGESVATSGLIRLADKAKVTVAP
jgi:multidrug efflux system membrane fusion protein